MEVVGISGNSGAGRVSVNVPMGVDYIADNWWASTDTAVITDITELKESLNSDITRLYSGPQQEMMNLVDLMQTMTVGNLLRIPQEMMRMKDVVPTYSTTRNTLSKDPDTDKAIASRRLELVSGVGETWRLFCEVDDATEGGPGAIERVLQFTEAVAGGAEFSLQGKIPFGLPERRFLRRGFFTLSAGDFLSGDFVIRRGSGNEELTRRPYLVNLGIATDPGCRQPNPATYGGTDFFLFDTTETGIPEMFDTMVRVDPKTPGAVMMGGNAYLPQGIFDLRPFPSAAATLTSLISTLGRL